MTPGWTERFEAHIGWRYTRSGRAGRRNGFLSFISGVSIAGIALGVAALIVVLSVMNGFRSEVRDRMLSVVAHVELTAADGGALPDWAAVSARAAEAPAVRAGAPFVNRQALVGTGDELRGAVVRGVDPLLEAGVTDLGRRQPALLARLRPGAFQALLGAELARAVGARVGDKVVVVAPGGDVTPAGVVPRLKQFTVAGTFESGHPEHDGGLVLVALADAARLFRVDGAAGVQLRLADVDDAPAVAARLRERLGAAVEVRDWTLTNRNWFDAVQLEKRLMAVILTLVVAVAAFNLVSTLVMTVTDKAADIAILRTLGASPRSVMAIFVVQGASAGVIGTLAGAALGLGLALNIDTLVPAIERALGFAFLPGDVYLISRMPSDARAADVVPVIATALLLSLAATLYPSWRASRVQPAQALRYE